MQHIQIYDNSQNNVADEKGVMPIREARAQKTTRITVITSRKLKYYIAKNRRTLPRTATKTDSARKPQYFQKKGGEIDGFEFDWGIEII